MAKEVEIKLELSPAALAQCRKLPLLRAAKSSAKQATQVSVYFDTDGQKLRRHGVLLRVRHVGGRYVQTVKATGNSGIFARDEWESEIADGTPDLRLASGTALDPLIGGKLRQRLKPMFETRVRRTVYPLKLNGSAILVALDHGTIKAGDTSVPVSEIELELKDGDQAALFDAARQIAFALPARLGVRSKSDRGYDLAGGSEGHAVKFAPLVLTPGMPARDAFRRIAHACLRQIVGNAPAVLTGDAEGLHQMRVGLRRLRAALSLFAALLDDPQITAIKAELKWLTGELGPARELEVLIKRLIAPVANRRRWRGVPSLSRHFHARREAAIAQAQDAVGSQRFGALALDVAAWLEIGQWVGPQDEPRRERGTMPIEDFAAQQLALRFRKIRKRRKSLADLDPRRRHKLRIQAKKLRYAADFFGSLFSGKQAAKRRGKFLAALERVQDCLGDLNDIAVDENLIGAAATKGRQSKFAAGLLTGREESRQDIVMADAEKALKHFADVKPFW
jgi:inorganic triphosphatase YgiF